jgi:hypothetical protein
VIVTLSSNVLAPAGSARECCAPRNFILDVAAGGLLAAAIVGIVILMAAHPPGRVGDDAGQDCGSIDAESCVVTRPLGRCDLIHLFGSVVGAGLTLVADEIVSVCPRTEPSNLSLKLVATLADGPNSLLVIAHGMRRDSQTPPPPMTIATTAGRMSHVTT